MNHSKSYVICATPRSGSTLLCDLLAETGVAGCPDSFFRSQSIAWWADYLNVSTASWVAAEDFDRAYLASVLDEGVHGTDVFGMRLMWESVTGLMARLEVYYPGQLTDRARLEAAFGPLRYIHLSREDKIAQAVSLLKAQQSGLWHIDADGNERERVKAGRAPAYDFRLLSELVAELETADAEWNTWFAGQRIEPVRITYGLLSTEPQATLATVLSALGIDSAIATSVVPKTAKLADKESLDWAARFRLARSPE